MVYTQLVEGGLQDGEQVVVDGQVQAAPWRCGHRAPAAGRPPTNRTAGAAPAAAWEGRDSGARRGHRAARAARGAGTVWLSISPPRGTRGGAARQVDRTDDLLRMETEGEGVTEVASPKCCVSPISASPLPALPRSLRSGRGGNDEYARKSTASGVRRHQNLGCAWEPWWRRTLPSMGSRGRAAPPRPSTHRAGADRLLAVTLSV